jgi:IMP dehydrogenase
MTVKELLNAKGKDIITIEGESSVEDAIRSMHARKISALIVIENGRPTGIFTERDIVMCYISTEGRHFREVKIKDTMTKDLIVAEPDDELSNIMSVMIQKNIRHLPVADKGRIVGMLSIRDVIQAQIGRLQSEIRYLKDYITGY